MFSFDRRALDAMIRRVQQMGSRARAGAATTAEEAAADVLAESRALVPVKTGQLRDSGSVVVTETADGALATVAYSAPHALVVHEDLTARHANGQPKFLESALNRADEPFREHGARELRKAMEG